MLDYLRQRILLLDLFKWISCLFWILLGKLQFQFSLYVGSYLNSLYMNRGGVHYRKTNEILFWNLSAIDNMKPIRHEAQVNPYRKSKLIMILFLMITVPSIMTIFQRER